MKVLSVRVQRGHLRTLRRLMRDHRLPSESAAARFLMEREERPQQVAFREMLRGIRERDKRYKGPRGLNIAEDHDS